MARNGFDVMDSDLHVLEPPDLYIKYMDPKWGDRIPKGTPRQGIGLASYLTTDGKPVRNTRVAGFPQLHARENRASRWASSGTSIRFPS